jgi:UDP-GlcNAc:undecaprenyl-phosphate GlcNAc-1-phosphate transferase
MSTLTFRAIFIATSLALALGLPISWLSQRLRLIDIPGSAAHKQHAAPKPLAGGLVVILTVFAAWMMEGRLAESSAIRAILWPALIVFIFGLIDDLRGLSVIWKLVGQILATVLLIRGGVQIYLFDQMPWLNLLVTGFWVIGITNAYNFVDSMDGLASGLGSLAAAFFMLVTFDANQSELSLFSAILLGACMGTFYFTAQPARFFLGDSGAQTLGFLLAGLGIAYTPVGFLRSQSWFIPILLVGVPIFDTTLVVFSRLRRGKPVYKAGRDHTYHRLVALGLDPNRAVLSMQFVALLLGCLAFIALALPPATANFIFTACLFIGLAAILFFDNHRRWP